MFPGPRLSKRKRTTDSMRERRTAIRQTIPVSSLESLFSKNSTNVHLPEDQRSIANKLAREEKVRTYV
jgi:hypothetical protein